MRWLQWPYAVGRLKKITTWNCFSSIWLRLSSRCVNISLLFQLCLSKASSNDIYSRVYPYFCWGQSLDIFWLTLGWIEAFALLLSGWQSRIRILGLVSFNRNWYSLPKHSKTFKEHKIYATKERQEAVITIWSLQKSFLALSRRLRWWIICKTSP